MTPHRIRRHFAHAVGWSVNFNLNLLHGRGYPPRYGVGPCVVRKAWDPSNAEALLQWTVDNVPPEMWPTHYSLGNELNECVPPGLLCVVCTVIA